MTDNRLRLIFMGTPDFSVPALEALHDSGHDIIGVYTQPPRPKGRGYEVTLSPVAACAGKRGLIVHHPESLKTPEEQKIFAELGADLAVVAAYGLILPKTILKAPKHGCINIHASLLPRWRGASPIQQAVWQGDTETGITLMQMDEGLDTGPVIVKHALEIHPHTTAATLQDDLSVMGAAMIVQAVNRLASEGKLASEPQDESLATYAKLLTKENGKVDWNKTANEIDRQLRALNPWPGVWTVFGGKRIKILEVEKQDAEIKNPAGEIIHREGHVACGNGTILKLVKIQPEGKGPMDFAAAVNGGYVKVGGKIFMNPTPAGCLALLMWAVAAPLFLAIQNLPAFQVLGTVFILTAAGMTVFQAVRKENIRLYWRQPFSHYAFWLLGPGLYTTIIFIAFKIGPVFEANIVNYLWPLLLVLFARIFHGEPLTFHRITGMIAGFAGAVVLFMPAATPEIFRNFHAGHGLALMAAFMWAFYSVRTKNRHFPAGFLAPAFFAFAVICLGLHFIFEKTMPPSGFEWLILIVMSITRVSYALWDFAMKKGNVILLASLSYFLPLVSSLLLMVFGEHPLHSSIGIGAAMIIGGCLLVNYDHIKNLVFRKS